MEESQRRPARVTAAAVANAAGVSVATVSLVVNGKTAGRVSSELIERVQAAVRELGYVVDPSASALSSGTASSVMLVAPDLSNPYFASVVEGVRDAIGSRLQLLLVLSEPGVVPDPDEIARLSAHRTAGFLIGAPSREFVDRWSSPAPTVIIDAPGLDSPYPTVNLDVATGATSLARHLSSRGHRRVGYLDARTGSATFRARREAFQDAASVAGIAGAAPDPVDSLIDIADAARTFDAVWEAWNATGVTAVVCATDVQAYGVLLAAGRMGLDVPGDLSVAGFDDLPYSAVTGPGLTTVALPGRELGAAAGRRLLDLISSSGTASASAAPIRSHLVVRGSA